jgi:hypothetical protein
LAFKLAFKTLRPLILLIKIGFDLMWQHDGQAGIRINEHRTLHNEITLPRSLAGAHLSGDC